MRWPFSRRGRTPPAGPAGPPPQPDQRPSVGGAVGGAAQWQRVPPLCPVSQPLPPLVAAPLLRLPPIGGVRPLVAITPTEAIAPAAAAGPAAHTVGAAFWSGVDAGSGAAAALGREPSGEPFTAPAAVGPPAQDAAPVMVSEVGAPPPRPLPGQPGTGRPGAAPSGGGYGAVDPVAALLAAAGSLAGPGQFAAPAEFTAGTAGAGETGIASGQDAAGSASAARQPAEPGSPAGGFFEGRLPQGRSARISEPPAAPDEESAGGTGQSELIQPGSGPAGIVEPADAGAPRVIRRPNLAQSRRLGIGSPVRSAAGAQPGAWSAGPAGSQPARPQPQVSPAVQLAPYVTPPADSPPQPPQVQPAAPQALASLLSQAQPPPRPQPVRRPEPAAAHAVGPAEPSSAPAQLGPSPAAAQPEPAVDAMPLVVAPLAAAAQLPAHAAAEPVPSAAAGETTGEDQPAAAAARPAAAGAISGAGPGVASAGPGTGLEHAVAQLDALVRRPAPHPAGAWPAQPPNQDWGQPPGQAPDPVTAGSADPAATPDTDSAVTPSEVSAAGAPVDGAAEPEHAQSAPAAGAPGGAAWAGAPAGATDPTAGTTTDGDGATLGSAGQQGEPAASEPGEGWSSQVDIPPPRPAASVRPQSPVAVLGFRASLPTTSSADLLPTTPPAFPVPPAPPPQVPLSAVDSFRRLTGVDLGFVPLIRGPQVDRAAADLGARAFTRGGAVHLPSAAGPADSAAARPLIAHELAHVAQQRALGGPASETGPHGQALEAAALAAERATAGEGAQLPAGGLLGGLGGLSGMSWTPGTGFVNHSAAEPAAPAASAGEPAQRAPAVPAVEDGYSPMDEPEQPSPAIEAPYPADLDDGQSVVTPADLAELLAHAEGSAAGPGPAMDDAALAVLSARVAQQLSGRYLSLNDAHDLDVLVTRIYDRLRAMLRTELLVDRERSGRLVSFR